MYVIYTTQNVFGDIMRLQGAVLFAFLAIRPRVPCDFQKRE